MADKNKKIISPIQARIDKSLLRLEKKKIKNGKEIKITSQIPLKDLPKRLGLGAALRGGGRAFMKGGKVK